ncbi:hypothetical protein TWF281_007412 [Arthrobotrys megalospora]
MESPTPNISMLPRLSLSLARYSRGTFGRLKIPISGRITIRLADAIEVQRIINDLNEKYDTVINIINGFRQYCESAPEDTLADSIELELSRMIFGSNFIERAGTNFEETLTLCKAVFRNEQFANDVTTRTRSRMEVIQHAKALKFFFEKFLLENSELTENLILETHRILCEGHDHDHDGTPWEEWAGIYRDCEIAASSIDKVTGKRKKSIFIRASAVPGYMRALVQEFNVWTTRDRDSTNIDPFEIASWLCTQFVNIHPFADGNGRMCRILLNAVLYKYTGLIACIGDNEDEGRDEYLEIANQANRVYHEEDCEVPVEGQTSHVALSNLVLQKVTECGGRIVRHR